MIVGKISFAKKKIPFVFLNYEKINNMGLYYYFFKLKITIILQLKDLSIRQTLIEYY